MPQQIINGVGRVRVRKAASSQASSYDTDAQAFITAAALADTTQKNAINDLVLDLKAAGVWTKMKALYPMVGGTATTHKFNLKDPRDLDAAYRLSFQGGWTHSATGALPNGSNGYANTNLIPLDTFNNTTFNHLSYYSRTDSAVAFEYVMGSSTSTGANAMIIRRNNNLGYGFADYASGTSYRGSSGIVNNSLGLFTFSQTGANAKFFKNNTIIASNTFATINAALSEYAIVLGAQNEIGVIKNYTNKQCSFASIGDGLTDLESNLFYQIVEKYQYALGRNVNANQTFYFNRNYSNETNAFIFNGAISDATQQSAINTLVNDLKAAGIWTKMKALYPMVGGTALAHKFNLVNPIDSTSAYALTFAGGWTHSSTGALPNGTTGYADTNLIPSSVLNNYNSHMSYYSRTNSLSDVWNDTGCQDDFPLGTPRQLYIKFAGTFVFSNQQNDANRIFQVNANSLGFAMVSRTSQTSMKAYRNASIAGSNTTSATGDRPGINPLLGGWLYRNSSGNLQRYYGDKQCAFASIGDGLTDLESNLFYQIVEKFQYTLGRNINASKSFYYDSAYSNETNAFIFNGEISNATQISAVNTLVTTLKTAGIWTKMKALYPMVGGTATSHKFNLVNPVDATSAYALSFNGGWTHSSTGALPNGTTGYANTNLIPASVLSTNSTHISYYSRTNDSTGIDIGVNSNNSNGRIYFFIKLGNNFGGRNNNTTSGEKSIANSNGMGHYINNRIDSGNIKFVKNGTTTTLALTSNGLDPMQITIGAIYDISSYFFGTKQCAFASIGDGLTDAESTTFYNAVQAFQTTLGRQV